jgi:crossover junction endodeoxyribonuclease RuvC
MATHTTTGIDPSLVGTAITVLDTYTADILFVTTINTKKLSGLARTLYIEDAAAEILSEYTPREIFIEGYSYRSKGRSIYDIGELGGILRRRIAKEYGGYWVVPPKSLKKFVTSNGNADKALMLERTYRKYGVGSETLKDNNQVDSYGLARVGIAIQIGNAVQKYEIEALEGIAAKCILIQTP